MSELQAQGLFDALKLLDKDLIDKVAAIAKAIKVEHLENDMIRISIEVSIKKD
jgi:hypothetical protein